jgi:hypothetical protein
MEATKTAPLKITAQSVNNRVDCLEIRVGDHEKIIYGDPKDPNSNGIKGIISNMNNEMKSIRNMQVAILLLFVGAVIKFLFLT